MKKVLSLLAAVVLLSSVGSAQQKMARRLTEKDLAGMTPAAAFKAQHRTAATPVSPKTAGDTISSYPWTEGFESATLQGFTFVDSDGDGFNWERMTASEDLFSCHSGDGVIVSASYDNDNNAVLYPDNWMILPAFTLPADASEYTLSWYEKGQDASYSAENYSVYICTTGRTVNDFTATTAVLTSTSTDAWVKKTVSLANYGGQTIFIAFRHWNVSDMFFLNIDDIRVGGPEVPEVTVTGPASVMVNDSVSYTAAGATTFAWEVDATTQSETGATLNYVFTTAGSHTVTVSATNSAGTGTASLSVQAFDCQAITTVPYNETFEYENPCWRFVSADPANDDRTGITTSQSVEGNSSYVLSSYANAVDYNQFLISPELDLPSSSDYMLKFWYMGYNALDAFRVKVSTTTADTASFTTVVADLPTVATVWTEVAYVLPAGTKYIAIDYYGEYQYYLYIDDLTIDEMGAPILSLSGPVSVGTGINANYVANVNLADTIEWFVDGAAIANTGNSLMYVFTTPGIHNVVVSATNTYGTSYDTVQVDVYDCGNITLPYAPTFGDDLGCWFSESRLEESGWFTAASAGVDGQVYSLSAQNTFFGLYEIDHDNWLFSPVISMPAEGNYEVAWEVKPYNTAYYGDHYAVYVITGTDSTIVYEETLNANMTDFVARTAIIPATVSGDFRVAFRHYDSEGGYVIILNDIEVRNLTAPIVTLDGPASVEVNAEATFTAVSGTATSYAWTVDGQQVSATGATMNYTFTATGSYTVAVTATNAAGSNSASMTVTVFSCDHITSFPYVQDFESADVYDCWTFIDADGDGYGWNTNYLRGEAGDDGSYMGHNGSMGLVGSASWVQQTPLFPDNWMITPAIDVPAGSNLYLSWFAKGQDASYAEEHYSVYIGTTGNSVNDFGSAVFSETTTSEWMGHNVSLADYAGQTIYVAFRHHDVSDMFYLDIDDIKISTDQVAGIDGADNVSVSVYPNPVSTVLHVEGEGIRLVEVIDVNGSVVASTSAAGINVENLASGVYMVRVVTVNGVSVQKIVKK